ncbi:MAG TPA: type II toxin-antitoxin system VapC family toxin [Pedomonas sp.]|uniref:type II toxin-antitoxin system VapC family toxin n=1 Tax=Pedomonas sp. TaxID=2976421 RepID=UPI002F3E9E24
MAWLIDTNVAIHLRDGHDAVLDRIAQLDSMPLLSAVSVVELEGGVYRDPAQAPIRRARLDLLLGQFAILSFDAQTAEAYGRIVAATGYSRTKVIDRMIAAQAIVHRATLITMNAADFRDIPGLAMEAWDSPQ